MSVAVRLGAVVVASLTVRCVAIRWDSDTRFEHIPRAVCEELLPTVTTIDDCMAHLGAPLWVWETSEEGRSAAVLAYGWYRGNNRVLRITLPLTGRAKGNFDFQAIDGSLRGLLLFFDANWTLVRWRRGRMQDITSDIQAALRRKRPASFDEVPPEPSHESGTTGAEK